jgi:hypothetical protein
MADMVRMPIGKLLETVQAWKLSGAEAKIAGELLREITQRLQFLVDVGLDYLTIDRSANSLSGGESQRIRLASQLGSGLSGVLYVLDEPTIGLHPRDNRRLIAAMHRLRDLGNTLLVVEHDRDVIASSDSIRDFGPGSGPYGGQVIAEGNAQQLAADPLHQLLSLGQLQIGLFGVIEDCIDVDSEVTINLLYKDKIKAVIVKWDKENDLAVLATGLKLKPLGLSQAEPWPGYWVMVLGSADGYAGSVSFGSVLNTTDAEIFITANTSHGNSGGPLIDNEGLVIGTTSWGHTKEQYNGAKSLNAMCAKILKCDGEWYWERD